MQRHIVMTIIDYFNMSCNQIQIQKCLIHKFNCQTLQLILHPDGQHLLLTLMNSIARVASIHIRSKVWNIVWYIHMVPDGVIKIANG